MARQRSKPQSNNTTEKDGKKMAGLTPEQIKALLGKTRQKGVYEAKLVEFANSGQAGICVNEEWVELSDKKATTLKQGFENAKEKAAVVEALGGAEVVENFRVIANDDKVFLINTSLVEMETEAA